MNNLNNIYETFETDDPNNTNNLDTVKGKKNDKRYKGKTVVLVDAENPWYQNDTTVPSKYKNSELFFEDKNIYKQSLFVPYGRTSSCVKLNMSKPDLGLGHSFLERKNKTENFTMSDNTNRNILILLLIIILVIYFVKKHKN